MEREENNLFKYATKELSQDAFICWLVNYINTNEKYKDIAKAFVDLIVNKIDDKKLKQYISQNEYTVEIKHQYKNIDVLLNIGEFYIIIEDKIKAIEHDDQINFYKMELIQEGINKNRIFTCYYKIYDEYRSKDKYINAIIRRKDMLELFESAENLNLYMEDYYNYLKEIEEYSTRRNIVSKDLNKLDAKYVNKIEDSIYTSFYSALEEKEDNIIGWGYADNRAGGTWYYASKLFNNVKSNEFTCIHAEINLKDERNAIVIKLKKNYKEFSISENEKIEDKLTEEYLENGKLKYFDREKIYIYDIENDQILKKYYNKFYKNLKNQVDIYDKVVTQELLEKLKPFGISEDNNTKGKITKNNNTVFKYYTRVATIDVNNYNLIEIEKILDVINEYLSELNIGI